MRLWSPFSPFGQFSTSLRPIFHFHVQHFSTGFPSKSYFIFVSPCPTACVDLPLPFGQFSTSLRPIFHFHVQQFSTGFLSKSYFIFVSPCPTACVDLPLPFGQFSTSLRTICHRKLPMPVFCPIAYNLAFAAEIEKVAAAAGQGNVLCLRYSDICNCNATLSSGCEAAFDQ